MLVRRIFDEEYSGHELGYDLGNHWKNSQYCVKLSMSNDVMNISNYISNETL